MMKYKIFLQFILLLVSSFATAKEPMKMHFPITNYTYQQYAAGSQNWNIVQQNNGLLYFANNYGLLEFDGKYWRISAVGNGSNVRALCIGQKGRLYAGASHEFGYYEPNNLGVPTYHSLSNTLPQKNTKIDIIWRIHRLGNSYFFVTENQNIFEYNGNKVSIIKAPENITYSEVINQSLYVFTTKGFYIYSDKKFIPIPNSELLIGKHVRGITMLRNSELLIATKENGLYSYKDRKLEKWAIEDESFINENLIFTIASSDKYIAIGTIRNGVLVIDKEGRTFRKINKKNGLQNNTVLSLFFDNNKSLWVGLDSGIDLIDISSPITDIYESGTFYGAGYCSLISGNKLYLGTNQGLYFTAWPISMNQPIHNISKLNGQVWGLYEIDNEILCAHHDGAFVIKENTAEKIDSTHGIWKFMKWNDNKLIVGSYDGLYTLSKQTGKWTLDKKIPNFDESCRVMEWDADGSLWMSHGNIGIFRFRFSETLDSIVSQRFYGVEQGLPSNFNNAVYKIDNEIIFTTASGLYYYDPIKDRIEKKILFNFDYKDTPYTLLKKDNGGQYWYIANKTLGFNGNINGDIKNVYGLSANNLIGGFENLNFVSDALTIFSHEEGFSLIHKDELQTNHNLKQLAIRSVYTTMPTDSLVYGYREADSNIVIELPYQKNSFKINWSVPIYPKYMNVEYSFCLEGSDMEQWSSWSSVAQKEYANLHEGTYTFRVRVRSIFVDDILEKSIQIHVSPPWYRSAWAYGGYFMLFVGGLIYLIISVNSKIEKNRKRIEEDTQKKLKAKERTIESIKAENLQNELNHKNQELANSVMNVIRKNEILMNIKDDVSSIYLAHQKKDTVSVKRKLIELQTIIKDHISYDNEWDKFEKNFDLANSNFFRNLQDKYPNLTLSEKKLSAFLKMNLTSKEIAPLLNISPRGVEICRYRLRKKLDLDRNTNLTEFLQKIAEEEN